MVDENKQETNPEQTPANTLSPTTLIPVRVEVYIGDNTLDINNTPSYCYEKLIPSDAVDDLEDELDTVVGQYDDNKDGLYELEGDDEPEPENTMKQEEEHEQASQ
jgi:hypothetical protein